MKNWAYETAAVFKILADATRCSILKLLVENPQGMYVGDIAQAVGISHSAASHQLRKLELQGVLMCVREGQTICYKMTDTLRAQKITTVLKLFF